MQVHACTCVKKINITDISIKEICPHIYLQLLLANHSGLLYNSGREKTFTNFMVSNYTKYNQSFLDLEYCTNSLHIMYMMTIIIYFLLPIFGNQVIIIQGITITNTSAWSDVQYSSKLHIGHVIIITFCNLCRF